MASSQKSTTRKNIGVFASRIGRIWGLDFINGVTDAAEANGINLIYFVGNTPKAIITPGDLSPSYGLYDLARPEQLSGIILSADIGHAASANEIKRFAEQFAALPIVSNAIELENVPSVLVDNIGGMRTIMRHLIEEHGYTRIAFIRGIKGQIESEQRFHAYKDELKKHKLKFDEKLVLQGDFSSESGHAAVRELLDARKVEFQAIAAANDRMAIGAMEALQLRGFKVPGQVAVTGFDDVRESSSLGVPLTTAHQPFYEIGYQAVEMLLQIIAGQKQPQQTILPAPLKLRWSCGCLPDSLHKAAVEQQSVAQTGRLENKRDAALDDLLLAANFSAAMPDADKYRQACGQAWDTFLTALADQTQSGLFLSAIENMVSFLQVAEEETSVWHNTISTLRRHALFGITDHTLALKAENLFQQARMLIGELTQRSQAFRRLLLEQQEEILQGLGSSIAPAMSLTGIGAAIEQHFPLLGIKRFYLMLYANTSRPPSTALPPSKNYHMLLHYDGQKAQITRGNAPLSTGSLLPQTISTDTRSTAIIMPLSLAENRFGFIWMETGTHDWEAYTRIRNLVSSALLRTMLVEQREQAQQEVERLLNETKQQAGQLSIAKEIAEQTAAEIERLYQGEFERREKTESMARASRYLSTLLKIEEVPQQILDSLHELVPFARGAVFLEQMDRTIKAVAHRGFPDIERIAEAAIEITKDGVYEQIAASGNSLRLEDVTKEPGWVQLGWLPTHRSWIGVPLVSKNKVIGIISLTREEENSFGKEDVLWVTTFATQASIALENSRLYDEVTRFNEMMERMVAQRVKELNNAYLQLEKMDKNKTSFIQIAAHELRTPLTVMKGYLTMLRGTPAISENDVLTQAADGVLKGTDRLHQIVNSMLDVVRLENQTLQPRLAPTALMPILAQIKAEYHLDLTHREIVLTIDEALRNAPQIMADSQLLQKALGALVVNAIKFTPDGGKITIDASEIADERLGKCLDIRICDTGIGIDPANHKVIFEKLYQLGKVELHSSGLTSFKGGGPGLGLAIVAGIARAHGGKVWVESPGYDEEKLPGSAFIIRIPTVNVSS